MVARTKPEEILGDYRQPKMDITDEAQEAILLLYIPFSQWRFGRRRQPVPHNHRAGNSLQPPRLETQRQTDPL